MSEENQEVVGQGNPRDEARKAIFDKFDEDLQNSGVLEDVVTEEPKEVPYKIAVDENGDPVGQKPVDEDEDEEEIKSEPAKRAFKINGKEVYLSDDEITERVQKSESADQKFQDAARLRREADELRAAQVPVEPDPAYEDVDLEFARSLQMGSEEDAAAAIKRMRTPSVKPDEIRNIVSAQISLQEAAQRFKTDYADIFEDPVLTKLVVDEDARLVNSGDKRTYTERYSSIGDQVRQWRDGLKKSTDMSTKQERKASLTVVPTASGRKVAPVEDNTEESPSSVIANMARARGQI